MIQFNLPAKLNGATLIEELNAAGVQVSINESYGVACPTIWEGKLWLDINEKDKAKAESVVAAHNG